MIDQIKAKLDTWQAWVALIAGSFASMIATGVLLKKCIVNLNKAYEGGLFLLNVKEEFSEFKKEILVLLEQIDEGQANQIQTRRAVMEEDEVKGWFDADPNGKLIWANRLYRELVGMESDHVRGRGWEAGIDVDEREEFLRDWRAAFDHQRVFERIVVLQSLRTHARTRVRLTATPVRRERDGKILSYNGNATPLPHERRSQSQKASA